MVNPAATDRFVGIGPVYPMVTPFTSDEAIDEPGVGRYLDHLIDRGASCVLVTAGTSRFNLLDHDEVNRLNVVTVKAAAGRCRVIAATPMIGSFRQIEASAQFAADAGADAVMVLYTERYYGDEPVVAFFSTLADRCRAPVMIHANPMRNALGIDGGARDYTIGLVKRLADHANIVGIKEECSSKHRAYEVIRGSSGKILNIPAGGSMRKYLLDAHVGAQTYLTGVGNVFPEIEETFFRCVKSGDWPRAEAIVRDFEDPVFEAFFRIGWHTALKSALAQIGVMEPYERRPLTPPTDVQVGEIRRVVEELKTKMASL